MANFNHIRLLRITGLFAYLCDGTPLFTSWATERLDLLHRPNFALLLCTLFYLMFGVLYLLVTNNLGSRSHIGARLFGLVLMTAAALVVGWYSHSGLSAILMVVVSVVLPWLVPFWIGVVWIVLQTLCLAAVFSTFAELKYSITLALLQASIYTAYSLLGVCRLDRRQPAGRGTGSAAAAQFRIARDACVAGRVDPHRRTHAYRARAA